MATAELTMVTKLLLYPLGAPVGAHSLSPTLCHAYLPVRRYGSGYGYGYGGLALYTSAY